MVLDFFAPWCGACPKAAQHLDHLAETYSERCQFVLISVNPDVDAAFSIQRCGRCTRNMRHPFGLLKRLTLHRTTRTGPASMRASSIS
eukprot:Skav226182  [mRNA]  locus=scaffold2212:57060:57323:+ [translate_table: standard]